MAWLKISYYKEFIAKLTDAAKMPFRGMKNTKYNREDFISLGL